MKNEIKLIIFDFDETLYEGEHWPLWGKYVFDMIFSSFDTETEALNFIKKYQITENSSNQYIANSFADAFGSTKKQTDYMSKHFYELDIPNLRAIENSYLESLKSKTMLAVVSNSSRNYVLHYMKILGIDQNLFSYIMQNDYVVGDFTKAVKYKEILKSENLKPEQVLVIGDNYNTDILPALELNINAEHIKNIKEVKSAVKKYINL